MPTELYDNATSTGTSTALVLPIGPTDTVLSVQARASIALRVAGGQFRVIIINPIDGSEEIAIVTGNAATANWTVTRGAEGSTAKSFPAGSVVKHILTAGGLAAIKANNVVAATGPVGTIVGKMQVIDGSGTSLGYIPIYNTIT